MPSEARPGLSQDDEWGDVGALFDLLARRPSWHARAVCHASGVDFFDRTAAGIEAAKAVCAACPALGDCRAWALAEPPDLAGVWGGLGDDDRRQLRGARTPARRPDRGPTSVIGREERLPAEA